jgi:hypothetical protein
MPIKVDARKYVGEYNVSPGHRERNVIRDYRYHNESPSTYKTDREDRIFDTKGFKDKLNEVQKEFSKKTNKLKKN